jgi:cell division protein FtsA
VAFDIAVAGLDIGSTKVCAVIAERRNSENLEITGIGVCPSGGMRKGVVTNIEATMQAVEKAIESAVLMAGREATSIWTGIGGNHIEGINSRGVVAVTGRNKEQREISPADIERVLDAARAVVIPMDRQILEVVPQTYIVDYQTGIKNPLGMLGMRLEAEVHIITCSGTSAQNLIKCVNRAGYRVEGLVLQPLAAGRATLTQQEKEIGVAVVDLGGGTTDVLVYLDNAPYSTFTVPLGGAQVTGDVSQMLNLPIDTAEKIKCEAGCCWEPLVEPGENILVPGLGGRPPKPVSRGQLRQIIEPRMSEILGMVKKQLDDAKLTRQLIGGIVLTGGGASISGASELASRLFNLQVRVGEPLIPGALEKDYKNPIFATAVGLAIEGYEKVAGPDENNSLDGDKRAAQKSNGTFIGKLGKFIKKEFF